MKLLITGGCGFIGSNFIKHITSKYPDYEIVNLDKLTYAGNLENLKEQKKNKKYKFVKGDICDKKTSEKLVKNSEIVVNFAAETHVDRSIVNAGSFVITDVFGTYTLLEACRKFNKKLIHVSTDEVYGEIYNGSFKESSPLNPRNPYSASKASAEMLVKSYIITHKLNAIITRSSNNYGPYQHPEKFIPKTITNTIRGEKIPVYGDGKNVRDWLFVTDNCAAIDMILHKGLIGETYNIGGKNEKTNIDVVKKIIEIIGQGSIEFIEDRKGHDKRYSIDIEKIKKLGWSPSTSFESGIKETIDWYMNNKLWWKKLL